MSTVHSIIGQNLEDELEIFGKPSENLKYQMKILQYPIHKFLMYLDFYEHDYEKEAVSYTHLRAHETVLDLVCRLLLAKKK